MTRTRVKICGTRSLADLTIAVDAGADAIGVIVDVPVETPREVDIATARSIVAATPPLVTSVLVTMPGGTDDLTELAHTIEPDVLQLNGAVDAETVKALQAHVPVIWAVDATDTDAVEQASTHADAVLLDSSDEHGAGGTGETHDWSAAARHIEAIDCPVILAGGLTPENVAEAVRTVHPYGVDVASGVETANGKDPAAVDAFVRAASNPGDR